MGKFLQFMVEEIQPLQTRGFIEDDVDINDDEALDEMNSILAGMTGQYFLTPYIALERVRKALNMYSISIPQVRDMPNTGYEYYWPVYQFGEIIGQNPDGTLIDPTKEQEPDYYVYFVYCQTDDGMIEATAEIMHWEDLQDLLSSDSEEEYEDDLDENILYEYAPGQEYEFETYEKGNHVKNFGRVSHDSRHLVTTSGEKYRIDKVGKMIVARSKENEYTPSVLYRGKKIKT